jgi:serine/threonine protein kinase
MFRKSKSLGDLKKFFYKSSVGIHDFKLIKLVGEGHFGRVFMVKRIATQDIYALKIIKLKDCSQRTKDCLLTEKQILGQISKDYCVSCYFSFMYKDYICFVLDYMPGGDIDKLYKYYGRLEE